MQALAAGNLIRIKVAKSPVYVNGGRRVPGGFAVTLKRPGKPAKPLGLAGPRYTVIHPVAYAPLCEKIRAAVGGTYLRAGLLYDTAVLEMQLPREDLYPGIAAHLYVVMSFSPNKGFAIIPAPVWATRIPLHTSVLTAPVRSGAHVLDRLDAALPSLVSRVYPLLDAYDFAGLAEVPFSDAKLRATLGSTTSVATHTRATERLDDMRDYMRQYPSRIQGSSLGVYLAYSTWLMDCVPTRGSQPAAANRTRRAILDPAPRVKMWEIICDNA